MEGIEEDWCAKLMVAVSNFVRGKYAQFMPVVAQLHVPETQKQEKFLEDLGTLLELNEDELPWVYLIHGPSGSVVPFSGDLSNPLATSPELMAMWARRTSILIELPEIKAVIDQYQKEDPPNVEAVNYFTQVLTQAEEELLIIETKMEEFESYLASARGVDLGKDATAGTIEEAENEEESPWLRTDEL